MGSSPTRLVVPTIGAGARKQGGWQVPPLSELLSIRNNPPKDLFRRGKPPILMNSMYNPSIEDLFYIIESCLRLHQSLCIKSTSDPRMLYFPFSWYLKEGMELEIDGSSARPRLINVIDNPLMAGNTYHNGELFFQCGQKVQVSEEISDVSKVIIPEEACIYFRPFESLEDKDEEQPHEQSIPTRCSVTQVIKSYAPLSTTGTVDGHPAPGDEEEIASGSKIVAKIYRMQGVVTYYLYAQTYPQLIAMSKYFRTFARDMVGVIVASGIERFFMQGMTEELSLARNAEIQQAKYRRLVRPLNFRVLVQEFQRNILGTLENIEIALSVKTD